MGYVPWQRENAYRRRFALVMGQKNQLWWDLPAAESFRLHQQIYRIEPAQFDRTPRRADRPARRRATCSSQPVRELSLGERMKMELIAALLHSPEVLFLDEPTIGLDVVAQHNIQAFLRHYQQVRQITILLTSHYMKDVAALCRRVVIIAQGRIIYDGSLCGHHRPLRRAQDHLAAVGRRTACPSDLARFGEVLAERAAARSKLRVDRGGVVPEVLAAILAQHAVDDVSVEDPPLEEVIAEMFSQAERTGDSRSGEAASRAEQRCRTSRLHDRLRHRHVGTADRMRSLRPVPVPRPGGRSCGSASKSGWSTGATSRWAR